MGYGEYLQGLGKLLVVCVGFTMLGMIMKETGLPYSYVVLGFSRFLFVFFIGYASAWIFKKNKK